MHREWNPNLEILELAVERLGPLTEDMVFVGGCATGLLLTDPAAPPIRQTRDVDVITEVASIGQYHHLAEKLRLRGFAEDQSPDAPICRWTADAVVLDVMPTDPGIFGFGNEWYRPALASAVRVDLPSRRWIKRVTAAYFLATKLVAFDGRGKGDYVLSHDMEDVVAVLDGCSQVVDDVLKSDNAVRKFLGVRMQALLADKRFMAALPGHLPGDVVSQARVRLITDRMAAMTNGSQS